MVLSLNRFSCSLNNFMQMLKAIYLSGFRQHLKALNIYSIPQSPVLSRLIIHQTSKKWAQMFEWGKHTSHFAFEWWGVKVVIWPQMMMQLHLEDVHIYHPFTVLHINPLNTQRRQRTQKDLERGEFKDINASYKCFLFLPLPLLILPLMLYPLTST